MNNGLIFNIGLTCCVIVEGYVLAIFFCYFEKKVLVNSANQRFLPSCRFVLINCKSKCCYRFTRSLHAHLIDMQFPFRNQRGTPSLSEREAGNFVGNDFIFTAVSRTRQARQLTEASQQCVSNVMTILIDHYSKPRLFWTVRSLARETCVRGYLVRKSPLDKPAVNGVIPNSVHVLGLGVQARVVR